MNKVNNIVICKDTYNTTEEFQNAIRDAIMVLLNNNYIMTVRYDEPGLGIVAIDYDYADQELGAPYPYWLDCEQAEYVECRELDEKFGSTTGIPTEAWATSTSITHQADDDLRCVNCNACVDKWLSKDDNKPVCIGVPEPFYIDDINQKCVAYPGKKKKGDANE